MAHPNLSHRRTHNLLLISKLLNQRDNVSPVTIVLDTLEQPAKPLLREYMRRAEVRSVLDSLRVVKYEDQ
jgi:elongator complex protein 5